MAEPTNNPALSPQQRDTARLLDELLGRAIAARYEDFCCLSSGTIPLHASKPMAAYALREIDSTLRGVLVVPMKAVAPVENDLEERSREARKELRKLEFDDDAITRALRAIAPRFNHKTQIQKIVSQLGLDENGDIARKWITLTSSAGASHSRSFHRAMKVDDEFRKVYQEPFDTVVRAVVVALRSRYASLMRRVEALTSMTDHAFAVKAFVSEIPGAMPLQWHFFQRITTGVWLPHLISQGLVIEPLASLESIGEGRYFGEWPLGSYLIRMACSDEQTRGNVVRALRMMSGSSHPTVIRDGISVMAKLPASESAEFAEVAAGWMACSNHALHFEAPNDLVKKLAQGQQPRAALIVARELLRVWDNEKQIGSHYGQHMYEHHLPSLADALVLACGSDALKLLVDLLSQVLSISGRSEYSHVTRQSIADTDGPPYDVCEALITAVCVSSKSLVQTHAMPMREIIAILVEKPSKILFRIALHLLSTAPSTAPQLATAYLLNEEFITASWCRAEYADLAKAWYQTLSAQLQETILNIVNALPDKHIGLWRISFERHHKAAATPDDERRYRMGTVTEHLWHWREALPEELQKTLEEAGDPDAWKGRMLENEEGPPPGGRLSEMRVTDVVAFLRHWEPSPEANQHTVTALAQELRSAVIAYPAEYAVVAPQLTWLRPIYLRHMLGGLQQEAAKLSPADWSGVLVLIQSVHRHGNQSIDPASLWPGDDRTWEWAVKAASKLLMAGLRLGSDGIPIEDIATIRSLVAAVLSAAPNEVDVEGFERIFSSDPYFASKETSRGVAVELCILFASWSILARTAADGTQSARRFASAETAQTLGLQLTDRSSDGRIPRAIMGRYLRLLHSIDPAWLTAQLPDLLPADDAGLRDATWRAHLQSDAGPLSIMPPELYDCYLEEITRLSDDADASDQRKDGRSQERFVTYVMVLVMCGIIPEPLLSQFEVHAPPSLRRRAMWFVGGEVSRPSSEVEGEARTRGMAYWERRLAAAKTASRSDDYREELGSISHWCWHGVVDEWWLSDQILALFGLGLAPHDAYGTITWLAKIAVRHVDRAVELLLKVVRCPAIERWNYLGQSTEIRFVLSEGLVGGSTDTRGRIRIIVNHLASIGAPEFMDLEPPE